MQREIAASLSVQAGSVPPQKVVAFANTNHGNFPGKPPNSGSLSQLSRNLADEELRKHLVQQMAEIFDAADDEANQLSAKRLGVSVSQARLLKRAEGAELRTIKLLEWAELQAKIDRLTRERDKLWKQIAKGYAKGESEDDAWDVFERS